VRDLREELEGDDGRLPPCWEPDRKEILVGTVLKYADGRTKYGPCRICVLEDEETGSAVSVWLGHAVLRGEFEREGPKRGDRVGIRRLPDDPNKAYRLYKVVVDRHIADTLFEADDEPATG